MPTSLPRVQVTVDDELAAALAAVDAQPRNRSRLIRDLALRGARATHEERERRESSIELLLRITRGETSHDPASASEVHATRERQAEA